MRRPLAVVSVPTLALLVALVLGVQLAPAAERGDLGDEGPTSSSLEFVGRGEQAGSSVTEFGYLTHIVGLDDAALFADPNPAARNETTARFSFFATTTIAQRFTVLPPPAVPSLIDVDSNGTLMLYFTEMPPGRSFDSPNSFAIGTAVAAHTVRLQDVIAALASIDPSRGVVDGNGELCQQTAATFRLAGEERHIGHPGLVQSFSSHGWTQLTSPSPPQSLTQFGGHTAPVADRGTGCR
jgi:hypothetical protein